MRGRNRPNAAVASPHDSLALVEALARVYSQPPDPESGAGRNGILM